MAENRKEILLKGGVILVTDRNACGGVFRLVDAVAGAMAGGVSIVQLRERGLCPRELLGLAVQLRELTDKRNAALIINDRVDIALIAGADGVHLGQMGFSPGDARRALGKRAVIGVSTHSPAEAARAERAGADYITLGPVYFTPSKAPYGEPIGIEGFTAAARAVNLPVYAIGGIKRERVGEVLAAGAAGVAVISAILGADDKEKGARDLVAGITPPEVILPPGNIGSDYNTQD